MNHSHIEEVFSRCDVRTLDSVAEEDIAHDKEVYVASMGWDYDQWPLGFFVVGLQLSEASLVDHNFLVDRSEDFMQEPGEHSQRAHGIVTEHLSTHLFCCLL